MADSLNALAAQRKDFDVRTFAQIQERKGLDAFRANARKSIVKGLMTPQMNYLNNLRYNIVQKHTELTLSDGFYYKGLFHTNTTAKVPTSKMKQDAIHDSLLPEMQEYERQIKEFNADKVSFDQGFSLLLSKCTCPQDVRDTLPDILLPVMGSPEHLLDRTRPEMYTLNSPLHIKQFEKVKDKIYFYLATALLG